MKKWLPLLSALALFLLFTACAGTPARAAALRPPRLSAGALAEGRQLLRGGSGLSPADINAPVVKSVSLKGTTAELGLGQYYNEYSRLTWLIVEVQPAGARWSRETVVSSNPAVVSVEKCEDGYYLYAQNLGSAVITVDLDGRRASRRVVVKRVVNIKKLRVSELVGGLALPLKTKTVYIGASESPTALIVDAEPDTASYVYRGTDVVSARWISSDERVAAVDMNGVLQTFGKVGDATITLLTTDGGKASYRFRVRVRPIDVIRIELNRERLTLRPGGRAALTAEVSPYIATDKRVLYQSSNKKVASVDAAGVVTGLKPGRAVISCRSMSGKVSARCAVTVSYNRRETGAALRFFGVGNGRYGGDDEVSPATQNAARLAADAFRPYCSSVSLQTDLTGEALKSFIDRIPESGVSENDVTVFYFAGHGQYSDTEPEKRGALMGVDGQSVSVTALREMLDEVPGTVVVIADACLSGQLIESKSAAGFAAALRDAFSASSKALTDSPVAWKYKIIAACRPLEAAYVRQSEPLTVFTPELARGLGRRYAEGGTLPGPLLADKDKDGVVNFRELSDYTAAAVLSYCKKSRLIYQTVMRWPASDYTQLAGG